MNPGPGDVRGGEAVEIEVVDDFLGQRARIGLALLGEHHGGVRLIVAEAQVRGGGDGGGGGLAERGGKGGGEAGFEVLEKGHGGRGGSGRSSAGRGDAGGLESRMARISSRVSAAPSWRRTSQLVNILAIAASVRRCRW